VGGPSSASRKRATTNVVARFLPFIIPSPAANACYAQTATTTTSLASKHEPEVVFFPSFDMSPTTTTSLASNREPEVVLFIVLTCHPPPPPPSRPNASRRWSILAVLTRLPPPPPPSCPNASQRWFFCLFNRLCHHHHLPRAQT
jgi:hypothetical protein